MQMVLMAVLSCAPQSRLSLETRLWYLKGDLLCSLRAQHLIFMLALHYLHADPEFVPSKLRSDHTVFIVIGWDREHLHAGLLL